MKTCFLLGENSPLIPEIEYKLYRFDSCLEAAVNILEKTRQVSIIWEVRGESIIMAKKVGGQ